jgi:hypothetical protein
MSKGLQGIKEGGMKQKNSSPEFTASEIKLVEQLREHPEMMVRVQEIMKIAHNEEGPLKTADEVEELLIQEVRQLGNTTMAEWATRAEKRVSRELREQDPGVRSRKKKR